MLSIQDCAIEKRILVALERKQYRDTLEKTHPKESCPTIELHEKTITYSVDCKIIVGIEKSMCTRS